MIYSIGDRHPVLEGDGHFIAPTASIVGSVTLKPGANVWFNAVLRGDNDLIEIGRHSNIQDNAVLHTDPGIQLVVGDNVTVGHRAVLHGCTIGNNSLIGIGSIILNNVKIGSDCIVGAHTLVTEGREFPDGVLILGSPGKVVRDLSPAETGSLKESADVYVRNSRRYRTHLKEIS
jgi:carbonic anhydrase/acetyltransferase-like protein (isoleucine patch superfamily)